MKKIIIVLIILWSQISLGQITIVASPESCNQGGQACMDGADCCSGTCSSHSCVTATNSITLHTPGNATDADFLVAQIVWKTCGGDNPSTPVGWTITDNGRVAGSCPGSAHISSRIYTSCVTGTPAASYTWTWGNNTGSSGGMLAFRGTNCGVEAHNGFQFNGESPPTNELITPALTSIGYGNMLVLFYSQYIAGGATLTLPVEPEGFGWNRDNGTDHVMGTASQWHLMGDSGLSPSYSATSSGDFAGANPPFDHNGGISQSLLLCPFGGCELPAPSVTMTPSITLTPTETPTATITPTPGTPTPGPLGCCNCTNTNVCLQIHAGDCEPPCEFVAGAVCVEVP